MYLFARLSELLKLSLRQVRFRQRGLPPNKASDHWHLRPDLLKSLISSRRMGPRRGPPARRASDKYGDSPLAFYSNPSVSTPMMVPLFQINSKRGDINTTSFIYSKREPAGMSLVCDLANFLRIICPTTLQSQELSMQGNIRGTRMRLVHWSSETCPGQGPGRQYYKYTPMNSPICFAGSASDGLLTLFVF